MGFSQKYLVMTDTHITREGQRIIGLDPLERLQACLDHAAAEHPDALGLILAGDLTHHGLPEAYERLKGALRALPWPVHLMIGNHDLRGNFRAAFPEAPVDGKGFVQSVVTTGDYRLVLMDTHAPEREPYHGGYLCADRLDWLKAQLKGQPAGKTILFTHHPPFVTGFPGMDRIGLEGREALCEIIAESPAIAMTISGHTHRTIWGIAGGKPAAVQKSPCHQMPMDLVQVDSGLSVDEPGAYGILLLGDDGIVLLTEDVGLDRHVLTDKASQ